MKPRIVDRLIANLALRAEVSPTVLIRALSGHAVRRHSRQRVADVLTEVLGARRDEGAAAVRLVVRPRDTTQLRLETGCKEAVIRKWARGGPVREATDRRLTKAAVKLGLMAPEPHR